MVNRKALLIVATALAAALILSSLAVTRTARSEGQTQANPDIVMFLRIDGIPGESIDSLHMNWIDIDAFNWSEAMASIGGGRAAGRINMADFHFGMATNKASPKLFLACATGRHITYADLHVCTPVGSEGSNPVRFLEFYFDGVTITSYNIAGSTPDYRPVEEFSIAFSMITITYTLINADGSLGGQVTAYYDLIANRGG
jgi:type VI secretion system secreted protein Hcp